jgi:4-amino-4-deoxy-L-arabinose transferase-like glycosyltransferase
MRSPSEPPEPRWVPWVVFLFAFALRALHALDIEGTVLVQHPSIDPGAYDARAREILAGDLLGRGVSFQDPLYPYLLAAMRLATGGSTLGPYLVHAAIGALCCVLLFHVGRRFIAWRAGALAGLFAAAYAPFVYLDVLLEKNAFTILFLLAALLAFPRPGPASARGLLGSGALLGAGALLRGNFLLVAPALALVAAVERRGASIRRKAAAAGIFLVGAALPILPFTLRNRLVGGEWVLTTAQAGTAFYLGNNPENSSGGIHHVRFNRQIPEFEADDWKREAERRTGRTLSRAEVSSFWFRSALRHIVDDPGLSWWLPIVARKAELLVNAYEVPDNTSLDHVERLSRVVRWSPLRFSTLAPLGIVGVALGLARFRSRAPLVTAFGVYGATLLFFPISDRFRAPLAAFLLLGAGELVARAVDAARARRYGALFLGALAVAAAALLVNHEPCLQPADTNLQPRNARLKAVREEATAWTNAREWDRAEAVLREAQEDPWLAKNARLTLDLAIVLWYGRRNADESLALAKRSIKPLLDTGESLPDGYRLLADLYDARGDHELAGIWRGRAEACEVEDWNSLLDRAKEAASRGEVSRAIGLLEEVVFVDGSRPATKVPSESYITLAQLHRARGDSARAEEIKRALAARAAG